MDAPKQAVALVFEHVDLDRVRRTSFTESAPGSPTSPGQAPLWRRDSATVGTPRSVASGMLADSGPDNAALKLLDNLCMMLTGGEPIPGAAQA
jgi:hypothetical protein